MFLTIQWTVSVAFLLGSVVLAQPTAPFIAGLDVPAEGVDPGELLLGELNCVACHTVEAAVHTRLVPKQAPDLANLARRIQPEALRRHLLNPGNEKPGTTMPNLFHGQPQSAANAQADQLIHYLLSLAPAGPAEPVIPHPLLLAQGRVLFHRTGCVACHAPKEAAAALFPESATGPTDPEAIRYVLARLTETSVPIGTPARKYRDREALAGFLRDPLAVRPSGRMPSLNLTPPEADAIATYLLQETPGPGSIPTAPPAPAATQPRALFKVDPTQARKGQRLFVNLGCAACHQIAPAQPSLRSQPRGPALADIRPDAPGGCLSSSPRPGVPDYSLSETQRKHLRDTLNRRQSLREPVAPAATVTRTLLALNCYACHSRDGVGGPSPSRSDYFTGLTAADLGDEGRIPPHLHEVGRKLRPDWLETVLTQRGTVRPYMATRMPQFGPANVRQLVELFAEADRQPPDPAAPKLGDGDAAIGRRLTGVGGYACITCHKFGGHPSLGIDVMDMTEMAKRLQPDWFRRYLLDPSSLRPGTRMPTFWPDGTATINDVLGGDAHRQINAIWTYLLGGARAEPPPMDSASP